MVAHSSRATTGAREWVIRAFRVGKKGMLEKTAPGVDSLGKRLWVER